MSQIEKLRQKLDEINLQLLRMINERASVVKEIGEIKKRYGVQKFDPIRERDMLERIVQHNEGPFDDNTVRHLFKQIFKASLSLLEQMADGIIIKRSLVMLHNPLQHVSFPNRVELLYTVSFFDF
ncbi:chorismate mutase, partial [Polycladomyces sp. WAk]|nr:chorismate mutase [Polycladomyces sp. WAk]